MWEIADDKTRMCFRRAADCIELYCVEFLEWNIDPSWIEPQYVTELTSPFALLVSYSKEKKERWGEYEHQQKLK
jgi:hypothetical protein